MMQRFGGFGYRGRFCFVGQLTVLEIRSITNCGRLKMKITELLLSELTDRLKDDGHR
jgi:hypothetical protein